VARLQRGRGGERSGQGGTARQRRRRKVREREDDGGEGERGVGWGSGGGGIRWEAGWWEGVAAKCLEGCLQKVNFLSFA
jgi:hypothetical protein